MHYNIVHITVHLGGGIGSVLWNWVKADKQNNHKILCLNYNYFNDYDEGIVFQNMRKKRTEMFEHVSKADIVIVHYWNHPMLFEYLIEADIPECRMCFWSHISGLSAPYVFSEKLIRFSDKFVFASPISYKVKEVMELPDDLTDRLTHIWTTGDISEYFSVKPSPHSGFNIGFVGTLDYSKLHPNFIDMCSRINIPDVMFIMIGGGCDLDNMKDEVVARGLETKFAFTGVIKDVKPYLSIIDVLGYPLNPDHFGTCEQVLGEAIAAGVIPIVMKNPAEEYILFQSLVKFVCENEDDYVRNMELLYRDKESKSDIASLIQKNVTKLYDSDRMFFSWENVFEELMNKPKRKRVWTISDERAQMRGAGIFIESLGEYGKPFEGNNNEEILKLYESNLQWHSKSKGSPRQYLDAFPDDEQLAEWVRALEGDDAE